MFYTKALSELASPYYCQCIICLRGLVKSLSPITIQHQSIVTGWIICLRGRQIFVALQLTTLLHRDYLYVPAVPRSRAALLGCFLHHRLDHLLALPRFKSLCHQLLYSSQLCYTEIICMSQLFQAGRLLASQMGSSACMPVQSLSLNQLSELTWIS